MADENDDLLDPSEIEALLNEAAADNPTPPADAAPPSESKDTAAPQGESVGDLLDPAEIEKLISEGVGGTPEQPAATQSSIPSGTEELLRQAEEGLAAAISNEPQGGGGTASPFGPPKAFAFQEFGKSAVAPNDVALQTLHDVELDIRIELGRTELLIDEVLQLRDGSVVPLDKLAGDPVDVIVNDRLIARGEVLVLNDNFCVRVTEILPPHL